MLGQADFMGLLLSIEILLEFVNEVAGRRRGAN